MKMKTMFLYTLVLTFIVLSLNTIVPFVSSLCGWDGTTCVCAEERDPHGICTGALIRVCAASGDDVASCKKVCEKSPEQD